MKLEFNSIEEVRDFANTLARRDGDIGSLSPGNINRNELARVLAGGTKIGAIRIYRAVTGADLRESKHAIEAFWQNRVLIP